MLKRYRHKKRGSEYTAVGFGSVQVSGEPLRDGDVATIYISDEESKVYIRRVTEFHDGRFEEIGMIFPEDAFDNSVALGKRPRWKEALRLALTMLTLTVVAILSLLTVLDWWYERPMDVVTMIYALGAILWVGWSQLSCYRRGEW